MQDVGFFESKSTSQGRKDGACRFQNGAPGKGERGIGIKVKALSSFSDPVRLLEELIKYGLLKVTVDE